VTTLGKRLILDLIRPFGWRRLYKIRVQLYRSLGMKIGKNVSIKQGVIIEYEKNIAIGDNVSIQQNCFLSGYGRITIGNDVSIAHGVSIVSSTHDYEKNPITRNAPLKAGHVKIGDNVWIGMKTSVFYNLEIGSGTIVGANSVIQKSVEPNLVVAGAPFKIIRRRNIR